jgi:hypothetical protein
MTPHLKIVLLQSLGHLGDSHNFHMALDTAARMGDVRQSAGARMRGSRLFCFWFTADRPQTP